MIKYRLKPCGTWKILLTMSIFLLWSQCFHNYSATCANKLRICVGNG